MSHFKILFVVFLDHYLSHFKTYLSFHFEPLLNINLIHFRIIIWSTLRPYLSYFNLYLSHFKVSFRDTFNVYLTRIRLLIFIWASLKIFYLIFFKIDFRKTFKMDFWDPFDLNLSHKCIFETLSNRFLSHFQSLFDESNQNFMKKIENYVLCGIPIF